MNWVNYSKYQKSPANVRLDKCRDSKCNDELMQLSLQQRLVNFSSSFYSFFIFLLIALYISIRIHGEASSSRYQTQWGQGSSSSICFDRSNREPKKRSAEELIILVFSAIHCWLQPNKVSHRQSRAFTLITATCVYNKIGCYFFCWSIGERREYELNPTKSGALCRRRRRSGREKHELLEGVVAHHKAKAAPFS